VQELAAFQEEHKLEIGTHEEPHRQGAWEVVLHVDERPESDDWRRMCELLCALESR
jgi:hypothetical protein